jgi:hypothetical protein
MTAQLEWLSILAVAVGVTAYGLYTVYNLSNALGDVLRS